MECAGSIHPQKQSLSQSFLPTNTGIETLPLLPRQASADPNRLVSVDNVEKHKPAWTLTVAEPLGQASWEALKTAQDVSIRIAILP